MQAKTKTYKYGKFSFRAYFKTAGNGYEVGLKHGKKHVFMGNFITKKEANEWWTILNKECRNFTNKFWINNKGATASFYTNFFSKHLYKKYYTFLSKVFAGYKTTYNKTYQRDVKKYQKLRRNWSPKEAPAFKAA
tara:strand:- start:141 stop:545 length:405 start_codon:yes stop_codon:yes gene_type:complete